MSTFAQEQVGEVAAEVELQKEAGSGSDGAERSEIAHTQSAGFRRACERIWILNLLIQATRTSTTQLDEGAQTGIHDMANAFGLERNNLLYKIGSKLGYLPRFPDGKCLPEGIDEPILDIGRVAELSSQDLIAWLEFYETPVEGARREDEERLKVYLTGNAYVRKGGPARH